MNAFETCLNQYRLVKTEIQDARKAKKSTKTLEEKKATLIIKMDKFRDKQI